VQDMCYLHYTISFSCLSMKDICILTYDDNPIQGDNWSDY